MQGGQLNRVRQRILVAVLWLTVAGLASAIGADSSTRLQLAGVQQLRIERPEVYWQLNGFVEMVPPVRLPTTHDATDIIRVYLFVPPDEKISARYLEAQQRPTLVFPPGTRADRIELLGYKRADGTRDETVMDVRGAEIRDSRQMHVHVYRPVDGAAHAPLVGWSWLAGDEAARQVATDEMISVARHLGTPVERPPLSAVGLHMLRRLNDCSTCHMPNHQRSSTTETAPLPRGETDQAGFYLPLSVLQDQTPLAATRPMDLNAGDPFVDVKCGNDNAHLVHEGEWIWFRCDGDLIPMGKRDIAAGLKAGDRYTLAVCQSRRYLYKLMDEVARNMFAEAFKVCGVVDD